MRRSDGRWLSLVMSLYRAMQSGAPRVLGYRFSSFGFRVSGFGFETISRTSTCWSSRSDTIRSRTYTPSAHTACYKCKRLQVHRPHLTLLNTYLKHAPKQIPHPAPTKPHTLNPAPHALCAIPERFIHPPYTRSMHTPLPRSLSLPV